MDKDALLKLNEEQLKAIKFGSGPLLIIAGAGTGKTTVITERIKHLILSKKVKPDQVLALTFTEKAAREMEERVDIALPYGYTNMWIYTFHSFCGRVLRAEALHIGLDPRYKLMTESEGIQLLRNNLFKLNLNYFRPLGNPNKFLEGILQHFSRLQDEDVDSKEYLRWVSKLKAKTPEEKEEAKKYKELTNAYREYEELKVREGRFDFGDLITKTLKLFREKKSVLLSYRKKFKYILVDEFQDTNYAQNELVKLLTGKGGNITVVADDDQCLPAGTKVTTPSGTVKIEDIKKGDDVITAVGKGHTSISKVSKRFTQERKRKLLTFKTKSGKKIIVTDNHKMFCFLPAHYDDKNYHFVYLMSQQNIGWRIGVTGSLPQRLRLERHADLIIGIGSYKTDEEARYFEEYYSAKYGIPTVPFSARPGQAISGQLLTRLFKDIDSRTNVKKMAIDMGLELDSPQFLVDAVTRGVSRRIKINFEMCARNYRSKFSKNGFVGNPTVLHQVSLETSNLEVIKKLVKSNITLVKSKKGKRVRKMFTDIKKAWSFAEKLQEITGGIIDKRFKVGRYNYQHLPSRIVPASHVFPGMYLPVLRGKGIYYDKVILRDEEYKTLRTYDLEIEKTHNFVANGVVVHNSIYRFRGAAVSNVVQFRKSFPKTKVITLTRNYRSTQEILDRSYDLIQHNNPDRLEVVEKINKKLISVKKEKGEEIKFIHVDRVENEADEIAKEITKLIKEEKYNYSDFAILVRANNYSEPIIRALYRHGIPHQFLGPGRLFRQSEVVDLISYLKVLYNFEDSVSLYRILSMEYFEIPGRDLAAIGNFSKKYNLSLFETIEKIDRVYVTTKTRETIRKIVDLIKKHLGLIRKETGGQLLYYFLSETGLLVKMLSPESVEAERKAKNISKFFDKLKSYEADHEDATVPAVVDWLELSMELGESPLAADSDWTEINAVNILTVHSAKGLEFPVVFLVNLVSQRFPTTERREQIPIPEKLIKEVLPKGDYHEEEERRLFYVGMTRAREKLYLTAADYYGEGRREKKLSPFIFEALGDKVLSSEQSRDDNKQLSILEYKPGVSVKEKKVPFHIDYLSYSQIETFKTCPLHYKLRFIYKVPTPQTASQSFGTTMHAVLKNFYLKVNEGQKPTDKLIINLLNDLWIKEGYASKVQERKFLEKGKDYLRGFLKEEFNPKVKTVSLELPFILPLISKDKNEKPLKIGGKIDRVDVLRGGVIEIIDYKTGATIPTQKEVDNNLQLSFYALAATKIPTEPLGKKPEKIKLSLYYLDSQEKITTERTKEKLEKSVEEIFRVREEIEKSEFKCSNHMFCQNKCEYSLFCKSD